MNTKFKVILFFSLFSITSVIGQEIKTDTIIFTQIYINEAEGSSPFLEYKNSSGDIKSDLMFIGTGEKIIINEKTLFISEVGIVTFFDEEYGKTLIGKKILIKYNIKKITDNWSVPSVKSLTIIN